MAFQHFEYSRVYALQLNMLMRLQEAAGFTSTDNSHELNSATATGL